MYCTVDFVSFLFDSLDKEMEIRACVCECIFMWQRWVRALVVETSHALTKIALGQ